MPNEVPSPLPSPPVLTTPILPITNLTQFLNEIRGYFDNMVYFWDQIFFKETFRDEVRSAWNNVRGWIDDALGGLSGYPTNIPRTTLDSLRDAGLLEDRVVLPDGRVWEDGNELRFKLATINDAWTYLYKRGMAVGPEILLEGISVLLESMSKAFPFLERVKEFTDYVKYAITLTKNIPPGDLSNSGIKL